MTNASSVVTTSAAPKDLMNFVVDLTDAGSYDKAAIIAVATGLTGLVDNDLFQVDFDVKAGAPSLAAPQGNPPIRLSAGESTAFQGTLDQTSNQVVEYVDDFKLTLNAGDVVRVTGRAG